MTGNSTSSGDLAANGSGMVKFLCSYGGRILPRYPDGKLRYVGGETRVLSVDRSITFAGSVLFQLLLSLSSPFGWFFLY